MYGNQIVTNGGKPMTSRRRDLGQFAQATLLRRQPEAVLSRVTLILILSVSPDGRVTVAVALLFLISGVQNIDNQACRDIFGLEKLLDISRQYLGLW